MQQQAAHPAPAAANLRNKLLKYKKPLVITLSVTVLQLIFGFDAKFCIINIIWLFV
jgi:hypothetical protein